MLKGTSELVIESLNEGNDASWDTEDLARCDGRQLLIILPLLGILDDNNLLAVLENLQQLAKFLVGPVLKSVCTQLQGRSRHTYSFHWSWCMWLAVPEVRSKRVEIRVRRTRTLW